MNLPNEIQVEVRREHLSQRWLLGNTLLLGAAAVALPLLRARGVSLKASLGPAALLGVTSLGLSWAGDASEVVRLKGCRIAPDVPEVDNRLDASDPHFAYCLETFPELYSIATNVKLVDSAWLADHIADEQFCSQVEWVGGTLTEYATMAGLGWGVLMTAIAGSSRLLMGYRPWQTWLLIPPASVLFCGLSALYLTKYVEDRRSLLIDTLPYRVSATIGEGLEKGQLSADKVKLLGEYFDYRANGDSYTHKSLFLRSVDDEGLKALVAALYSGTRRRGSLQVLVGEANDLTTSGIIAAFEQAPEMEINGSEDHENYNYFELWLPKGCSVDADQVMTAVEGRPVTCRVSGT